MTKEPRNPPRTTIGKMTKLAPIPEGARVQKRPVMKRQQPRDAGPAANASRIVYISTRTPFMSAVSRVRRKLDASLRAATAVDKRAAPKGAGLYARIEGLKRDIAASEKNNNKKKKDGMGEDYAVTVMGTGRAIEKVVGLAGWFQQEGDCVVEVRTGTTGTVDDVIAAEDDEEGEDGSRVRMMNTLEVSIRLK